MYSVLEIADEEAALERGKIWKDRQTWLQIKTTHWEEKFRTH